MFSRQGWYHRWGVNTTLHHSTASCCMSRATSSPAALSGAPKPLIHRSPSTFSRVVPLRLHARSMQSASPWPADAHCRTRTLCWMVAAEAPNLHVPGSCPSSLPRRGISLPVTVIMTPASPSMLPHLTCLRSDLLLACMQDGIMRCSRALSRHQLGRCQMARMPAACQARPHLLSAVLPCWRMR